MTAEIEGFIRQAAIERGIDPDIAIRVAESEGGVDEYAKRGTFDTGSSWYPFQLHWGGPGYEYLGTVAGMGSGFSALTGWQPGDPAAWRDSVRYALNRAKLGGWGAWYGAAAVGVDRWEGIDRDHPWNAGAEIWDYERAEGAPPAAPLSTATRLRTTDAVRLRAGPTTDAAILTTLPRHTVVTANDERAWWAVRHGETDGWVAADFLEPALPEGPAPSSFYDPDQPVATQEHDYDCSQDSLEWGLWALGRRPSDQWLEQTMIAEGVMSTSLGLLDASGAGLAAFVDRHYAPNVTAYNLSPVSYAQVSLLAGSTSVLIGLRRWGAAGHWCGVRRFSSNLLELAQVGGNGPIYGQQTLDHAGFDARGPGSAVVLERHF